MAVLLLLSVALLTLYFREADSGVAHGVQGGVLARRRAAAERHRAGDQALPRRLELGRRPVQRQVARTRRSGRSVEQLRARLASELTTQAENDQLRALLDFQKDHVFPKDVTLVTARVIARTTSAWYSTVTINAGSDDGVDVYDPWSTARASSAVSPGVRERGAGHARHRPAELLDAMVEPGGAQGIVRGSVTGDVTLSTSTRTRR